MVFGACAAALIAWNLSIGIRLSTMPGASRGFRLLSALDAFLFLPALVIGLLAPTAPGARVLGPLAWLWPLVAVSVLTQAAWIVLAGRTSRLVSVPIALFDLLVAWVAVTRWALGLGVMIPLWVLTPGVAISSLVAAALGKDAFLWGAAVLVPPLVPAAPARWRSTRAVRAVVATGCAAAVVMTGIAWPGANDAARTVRALDAHGMAVPTRADFAIGVRLFGSLSGAPTASVARNDVALADSLGVTALHVVLTADGVSGSGLDSIARSIEARRDSVVLVVTLGFAAQERRDAASEAGLRARLSVVERIMRRLQPDVLIPADGLPSGTIAADLSWWRSYYVRAATTARSVDRDVTVALATDASSGADSSLVEWVLQGGSPVDALALRVGDHGANPSRFVAALEATARWVSFARVAPAVWIVGVPASPTVTGELAQQSLVRHAIVWGAAHPWVRGVIAGDVTDEFAATGLRTAMGRSRRALAEVGAAIRAVRDLPPAPPAPAPDAVDSTTPGSRRPGADTLLPRSR